MFDIQSITSGLRLGNDGIWHDDASLNVSYPSGGNETYFAIEDRSFWFRHRNNCILSIVKSHPPENGGVIFDIGGGNGFVAKGLANAGFDVVLVEPGLAGAANAKQRGLKTVICATTDTARFKPHSLPAVGLFDVVEHMEDDLSFIRSIKTLLKEGGLLYLTVPAYPLLWSDEDRSAGHFRRYSVRQICRIIENTGMKVEFSTYFFRWLPVPIALFRALPYRLGLIRTETKMRNVARDHAVNRGAIARLLDILLNPELENLKASKPMGFGGSCLIVARCP